MDARDIIAYIGKTKRIDLDSNVVVQVQDGEEIKFIEIDKITSTEAGSMMILHGHFDFGISVDDMPASDSVSPDNSLQQPLPTTHQKSIIEQAKDRFKRWAQLSQKNKTT